MLLEAGIVGVEPAFKPGSRPRHRVESHGTNKGRSLISVGFQDRGRIGQIFRQRHPEILYLMELRIRPSQNALHATAQSAGPENRRG